MPMSLSRLFLPKRISEPAHDAYVMLAERSRDPHYFTALGVADTLDGRFDMMALVVGLSIRRIKRAECLTRKASKDRHRLAQELFDYMFDDLDRALREIGVGDLSIGKRIKKMAHAFYGRVDAYGKALDADDQQALKAALIRNLYRGVAPSDSTVEAMAAEVIRIDAAIAAVPIEDWMNNEAKLGAFR